MTMLAVGRGLRDLAQRGMSAVSAAESKENQADLALETAQTQQQNQLLGTGAGMGGMVGANRMLDASKAANEGVKAINSVLGDAGTASRSFTGGLEFTQTVEGVDSVLKGAEAVDAIQTAGTLAEATGTAGATAAVEGGVAAASQAGPMAQLATMAAPVAIGLGVAFLLNKLFD